MGSSKRVITPKISDEVLLNIVRRDTKILRPDFLPFEATNILRLQKLEQEVKELERQLQITIVEESYDSAILAGAIGKRDVAKHAQRSRGKTRIRHRKSEVVERLLHKKLEKYCDAVVKTEEINRLLTPKEDSPSSAKIGRYMSVLLSITFLIGALISLYIVVAPTTRLSLICVYIVCFAVSLLVGSNARAYEVIVATTTFAAVLVVFISSPVVSEVENGFPSFNQTACSVRPYTTGASTPEGISEIAAISTIRETFATTTLTTSPAQNFLDCVPDKPCPPLNIFATTCPATSLCTVVRN